jgi:coenzyme F420-reducing hydrogenase delta subunit
MCTGAVDPIYVVKTLMEGADGVSGNFTGPPGKVWL